ncbi:MAG: hypothetical protein HY094_02010 [Candidatus Melainabacteria bacterium]|nr:hypothetical protein [Candidatus Melainabacteria bacterium]
MKDITQVVKNGNLTAKERALVYINAEIEKDKTGKEVLTAEDIKAIKNPKAFINDSYIDTYNNHIETWRAVIVLGIDAQILFSKATLVFQGLLVTASFIAKSTVYSLKLEEFVKNIESSDETIKEKADVYFELSYRFIDDLKPFTVVNGKNKSSSKSKLKVIELSESSKKAVYIQREYFIAFYEALLTYQDILKKVSKALDTDVCYKVNEYIKALKENAKNYNKIIDMVLVDYHTDKNAHDEKLQVQDKTFKTREDVYLDLEDLKVNQKVFEENIGYFEQFLGKGFWEGN